MTKQCGACGETYSMNVDHVCPEPSTQGQLGHKLLTLRRRSPKAPLSKLHDKLMERAR